MNYIAEDQFDERLQEYVKELKKQTEVELHATILGALEYALDSEQNRRKKLAADGYGYEDEEELQKDAETIRKIIEQYNTVDVDMDWRGTTATFTGKYSEVMKLATELYRFMSIDEVLFDESSLY